MKVAVSIPDQLFRDAEQVSRRLRVPRSQLYSRALEAFVRQQSGREITAKLDFALAKLGSKRDRGWENASLEVLRREKD